MDPQRDTGSRPSRGLAATDRPLVRLADMLGALAFASDLAFGVELQDGARSCLVALRIADELALSAEDVEAVYYTALLKDAGCTAWTGSLASFWRTDEITARRELILSSGFRHPSFLVRWMWRHIGTGLSLPRRVAQMATVAARSKPFVEEGFRSSCEVATLIAARLGMSQSVQQALRSVFEEWDGKGHPDGLRGEEIPVVSRVVLPAFFLASLCRVEGRLEALAFIREGRGTLFDPRVADAIDRLARESSFFEELDESTLWERVADQEPSGAGALNDAVLDSWAEVFADFGDLKAPHLAAHSRRVATLACALAQRLGCGPAEVSDIRRAALAHDLGLVAVPTYSLEKPPEHQSSAEREQIRLHPYTAGRLLSRVPGFAPLIAIIQAHHERYDGTGFHQGLKGDQIPAGARIIAVADAFDDLTHDSPGSPALEVGDAARLMYTQSGKAYAPDVMEALKAELDISAAPQPRTAWPAGLTEREVEILRMATRGVTRAEIARTLVVSEHTVRHHLSHIYEKTGVTTRVGATLWAMEHGLFALGQK